MGNYSIVLATHGRLGEELVKSAEMIVGKSTNIYTISLLEDMSFEDFLTSAKQTLDAIQNKFVVLVDLFGGTPSNVMTALIPKYEHKVITGVNLPILIELYLKTTMGVIDDSEYIIAATELAKTCVVVTNDKLG